MPRTHLALLLLALTLAGCGAARRAWDYPFADPIFDLAWYRPSERVAGAPGTPLPLLDPAQSPFAPFALERAVALAREQRSCALLVLYRGKVALERYWCGLSASSRANGMSMAKTVVALLLGVARAEGRWQDAASPAARYLPAWRGDSRRRITVEELLQMRSGLRNERNIVNPTSDLMQLHLGDAVARTALAVPAAEPPGARFDYNNVNTQVLSLMLERVTGERYARYLSQKLWQPLGAGDAAVWLDRPGGTARTYCCLMATARDWARLGLLLQGRGRHGGRQLVPRAWVERMLTPSPREPRYGYQIWLGRRWKEASRRGDALAFVAPDTVMLIGQQEQRVYVVPSRELVVVRLGHDSPTWQDAALPNLLLRGMRSGR